MPKSVIAFGCFRQDLELDGAEEMIAQCKAYNGKAKQENADHVLLLENKRKDNKNLQEQIQEGAHRWQAIERSYVGITFLLNFYL